MAITTDVTAHNTMQTHKTIKKEKYLDKVRISWLKVLFPLLMYIKK